MDLLGGTVSLAIRFGQIFQHKALEKTELPGEQSRLHLPPDCASLNGKSSRGENRTNQKPLEDWYHAMQNLVPKVENYIFLGGY